MRYEPITARPADYSAALVCRVVSTSFGPLNPGRAGRKKSRLPARRALLERLRHMTGLARTPECAAMRIVCAMAAKAGHRRRHFGEVARRVTGVTLQSGVGSGQRILGVFVVIEAPEIKTVGVVATAAIGAKPAFVMRILVATFARPRRVFVCRGAVTGLARHGGVKTDEWKPRDVVIKDDLLPPARFSMTTFASLAELTVMGIVFLMASDARHRQFVAEKIAGVTRIAFDLLVAASQRELGRLGMIESDHRPFLHRVAGLALDPVTAIMDVLCLVTTSARPRQVLIAFADMTDGALHVFVCPFEGKLGLGVIKGFGLMPADFFVTARAILAQFAFVRVVFFMTRNAR